jgi:hypothetical protein
MTASVVWKARVPGTSRGSQLSWSAGLIVGSIRADPTSLLQAWTDKGKKAWSLPIETGSFVFPFGSDLYVDGTEALRISAATGAVLARRDVGAPVDVAAPLADWPVYFETSRVEPTGVLGLNPETLDTEWAVREDLEGLVVHGRSACLYHPERREIKTIALPEMTSRIVRAPFESPDGSFGGHTHAAGLWCQLFDQFRYGIDAAAGATVWQHFEPEAGFHGFMTQAAGDHLYCGNRGISCYDARTGELVWRQPLDGGLLCSRFHLRDDIVWAGTQSGGVFILRRADGEILARHVLETEPKALAPLEGGRVAVATYQHLLCLQF